MNRSSLLSEINPPVAVRLSDNDGPMYQVLDDLIKKGERCVLMGDLNVYTSDEPGYASLLSAGLIDPAVKEQPTMARWKGRDRRYAKLYTQSTRYGPLFSNALLSSSDSRHVHL